MIPETFIPNAHTLNLEHSVPSIESLSIKLNEKYKVVEKKTIEAIEEIPSLSFLLGQVTTQPLFSDDRPDNKVRPIWLLKEGSGLFGLKNPADAERWKGIFNHVIGTARQTLILSSFLVNLSPSEIESFAERGYDTPSLSRLNPLLLRDFMLVSHAGRREADEMKWHANLVDPRISQQRSSDSAIATVNQLRSASAPKMYLELMRVEAHDYLTGQIEKSGMLRDFEDISLTIPDWMFGQKPNSLQERFLGLRASHRLDEAILDKLEMGASRFEVDFQEITGTNLLGLMTTAEPFAWEGKIREAYCATSGIDQEETFPDFHTQYLHTR